MTATDFVDHAGLKTVLDNLIHRGDIPPLIAALTQARDRTASTRASSRHADFLAQDVLPALRARLPLREDAAGVVLVGASLGAVASLVDRLAPSRRRSAAWSCSPARSSSTEACCASATRCSGGSPISSIVCAAIRCDFRGAIFVGCGIYEGLIGQNRALGGLPPAARPRGAVPRAARRPPLAELARPDAGRADVDLAGPARSATSKTVSGRLSGPTARTSSRRPMGRGRMPWPNESPEPSACRWAPISAGRSATRSWSGASTSQIPYDGDTLRFHVERVTIEPFDLRQPSRYDVVIDRLTHWYHTSREWIKKAILLNDLYVFNNPWSLQSNEKQTTYCAMMRLGLPVPDTWLIPPKAYKHSADLQPTLERYARYFDLGEVGRKIGFPLFMKPYDGGAWVGVSKIDNEQELWRAYEHSGTLIMNLQAGVVPYDYFVRCIGLGPQTRCVNYDPGAPLHNRYLLDTDFLGEEDRSVLEDMTLTINSFFGWDFNSCEALRKDGIWYPIDFANACPDSPGHLAALPLSLADQGEHALVAVLRRHEAADARQSRLGSPIFEIAGQGPAVPRAAARLRPASRTSASRPIGSTSSATSISAISTRSPTSCSARRSPGMRCTRRCRPCSRRTRSRSSPSCSGAASRRGADTEGARP